MKRWLALAIALLLAAALSGAHAMEGEDCIDYWKPDSPAMKSIMAFVAEAVDETSEGFIPVEDRIAVFDNDGTLYGERFPTYFNDWLFIHYALHDEHFKADRKLQDFARQWEAKVLRGIPMEDFDAREREMGPQLYQGLTPDEYAGLVRGFKALPVWGFDGMTYGEAYFQPMVALVKYLRENDFAVYIVTATYRDAVRVLGEGVMDAYVPADRVIGTDLLYTASGDAAKESMFYELTPEDELQIAGSLFIKNQKTNKATAIQREIGRVPVLAFGNSTGDFSMATYTLSNPKYAARAYMLLCDDTQRDYGDPEAAAAFKAKCDANGFITISEKDEFDLLYPYGAHVNRPVNVPALIGASDGTWTEGSKAAESMNSYLKAVTDPASPDYIPVEDRIAVFDLDGTLMCETDPFCFEYMVFADYALNSGSPDITDEVRAVAQEILDAGTVGGAKKPSNISTRQAAAAAVAYRGMTMAQVADMVERFKDSPALGFDGMTRGEAYYRPMLELFEALQKNDFDVYIVTATERNIVRAVIDGVLDIPPSHVIGTEYGYTATGQGDAGDGDYMFQPDDQIVFDGQYFGENAKTCKVDAIVREIGQQPVLAFGNTSGDVPMAVYTISNNPHKSAAFMVLADDADREYGNAQKAAEDKADYESQGFVTISMRDDFATIYGDGVTKTAPEKE